MSHPCLAAVTLDPRGGGIAAVSRLLWQVLQDRHHGAGHLVTLLGDGTPESLDFSIADRVRFGGRVAAAAMGGSEWMLYTHVSLSRVQRFVPWPVRRPFAVFLHGVEVWRPFDPALERVIARARLLIANSRFTAARAAEVHPRFGPISVCPLALPPSPQRSSQPSAGSGGDIGPHAVLVVGRMMQSERYKGHDELLESWRGVIARVPSARLVFAGEGDDERRLQQKAGMLGIDQSVLFTGFVSHDDLHSLYRRAAVFAMPSRNEGFGLVYLEAMSHGLPCIGSTADAAREIIRDGSTGYLVHQQDKAALVHRIVGLLTDEARRAEMGGLGRRRLEEHFSYRSFAERMTSLLDTAFPAPASTSPIDSRAAR